MKKTGTSCYQAPIKGLFPLWTNYTQPLPHPGNDSHPRGAGPVVGSDPLKD